MSISQKAFRGGADFEASMEDIQAANANRDSIAEDQAIHPQVNTPQSFTTTGS
jgi:hypothetical protein